jgi:PadR family transcriptional regulator, regulatory protein AphA
MDLRSAILGLLSWKPASGYDLKRLISDSDIMYWSGNNNQIYTSLLELQKEGLVTAQVQLQQSLPAKKLYSITEAGRSELKRSLLAAPELPELRKGFLIQLAWAESLSDEEVLALLEAYEEEIDNRLRMLQRQSARPGVQPGRSQREKYLWQRIAENLIEAWGAELDWARQTALELRAGKFPESSPGGRNDERDR